MTPKQAVCALGAHTGPVMSEGPPLPSRRVCPLFAPRGSNQTRQRKEFIFEEEEGKEEEKMQSAEVE